MRTITLTMLAGFICFFAAQAAATEAPMTQPKPDALEGWIVIEEYYFIPFDDEPDVQFNEARESFIKRDTKAAAKSIRKSIAFLGLEAGKATDKSKGEIMASIDELRKLADKLEAGADTKVKDLDIAFSRAHKSLASHAYLKASAAWGKKNAQKTGEYLRAGARHLEQAFIWSGHEIDEGTGKVINEARLLSGKMVEGAGWVSEKVGTTVEALGNSIGKLGEKIEPSKK